MNMPGRYWYVVAILIWLGGMAAAGLFLWSRLAGWEAGLTRVIVPGSAVLDLAETGSYTIFHESHGVIDGRIYAAENISGLRVQLRPEPSGEPVPLTKSGSSRYSINEHRGYAVLAFELPAPGRYRLLAGYDDGRTEPKTVLAVGQGFVARLVTTILTCVAIGLGSAAAGIAIWIVVFLKRRRAKIAAAAGAAAV
jgi:hypothetical protein